MVIEQILLQIAVWGGGTLIACMVAYGLLRNFQNPFDELDEEDLKEIDEVGKIVMDLSGNTDKMLP